MTESKSNSSDLDFFRAFVNFWESTEIDIDRMNEKELDQLLKEEKISFADADKKFREFLVIQRNRVAFRKAQLERAKFVTTARQTLLNAVSNTRQEVMERINTLISVHPNLLAGVSHRNFQEMTDKDLASLEQDFRALLNEEG